MCVYSRACAHVKHVHTHYRGTYECVHVHVCTLACWRPELPSGVFPDHVSTLLVLSQSLSLNLELKDSARLAGQWGFRNTAGTGDLNSGRHA